LRTLLRTNNKILNVKRIRTRKEIKKEDDVEDELVNQFNNTINSVFLM
jgi:hypothetical protein